MSIPPIKRRGAPAAVLLLAALLLAVAISSCGTAGALTGAAAGAPVGGAVTPAAVTPAAEPVVPAGICADGTSSSAAFYATRFTAQLAAAAGSWLAAPPANPSAGGPGQPGLHLVYRSVTTTSISTDGPSVNDTIPGVTAIAAEPTPADPNYNDDLRAWLDAQPGWHRQAAAATAKARTVAAEIRGYQVARGTYSAIYSCLSGAVAELGQVPGPSVRLVTISDFQNNEPIVGLSLGGARVLMVEICPADASTGCPQRFAAARSLLLAHGASQVSQLSADALTPSALVSFWRS
jgi:hypothetical protein